MDSLKILTGKKKQTAEEWCKLLSDLNDDDVRMVDVVIQTAANIRAMDAAKTDKPA